MIPLRLSLTYFLSYRQASLDFRGLHTACICGANGAGKSSLLEAITWVLWGQSRVAIEDDVIHAGASEVTVALIFVSQGQIYRVIRRRHRQQSTVLEFQVAAAEAAEAAEVADVTQTDSLDLDQLCFRSLTAKGLRATQQGIVQTLKLDYDTFVNSAYLRQGRADEFMLKRPNERKQVLADLLGLNQYEALADQAKERARQHRAEATVLGQSNQQLAQQLSTRAETEAALAQVAASLAALQQDQDQDQARRASHLAQQQQRQTRQQQSEFTQQQRDRLSQSQRRLEQEQLDLRQQQQQLQSCLDQTATITQRQGQWQQLQQQDEQWSAIAQQHRSLVDQRRQLEQQLQQRQASLMREQERLAAQQASLADQRDILAPILAKAETITAALAQLQVARSRLQQQDQLQAQVAPLLLRQQQLEREQQTRQTQLTARLEALARQAAGLEQAHADLPPLQEELEALTRQVNYLEGRQQLQEKIREKGLERRSFLERLMAHRQDYESQIISLDDKVRQLTQRGAPCPLCDRPLDDKHLLTVQGQHEGDRQGILDLLIVVRDQMLTTEREIEVLREEYRTIELERVGYCGFLERRGQVQQQLAQQQGLIAQQQSLAAERTALEQELAVWDSIAGGAGGGSELQQLRESLAALAYDDRSHALARGEVDRWRWAELKQAELKQAQRRWAQLEAQEPALLAQQLALEQQCQDLAEGAEHQALQVINAQLAALDYDPEAHGQLRQHLRELQSAPLAFQALALAREQMPGIGRRLGAIAQHLQQLQAEQTALDQQLDQLTQALEAMTELGRDPEAALAELDRQMQQRRQRLDGYLAEQGRLEQRRHQLRTLQEQYDQQLVQEQHCLYQQRIHQELAQAFGKNGIQTLLIENLLPQLERETNRILSRLSDHQLQVQFVTQKAKRSGKGRSKGSQADLMDTLDIRIGDAQGTRPYETYSGGEAFRVNFSIRLALARLLAQRSGTALQLLIVDEGFGTQDGEGCDRLIGAINAIATDFACILTITHMPQFKEAFQARIEVTKGAEGSQLTLAV